MKASRVYYIRVLLIGLVCPAVGASAQQRPPIADEIAKTYGLESWGQVEAIRYTFKIDWPALKLKFSVCVRRAPFLTAIFNKRSARPDSGSCGTLPRVSAAVSA